MLTKWETLFLLLLTLPIMGHVVILPLMLDVAGRDAWISILLSLPFAFMYGFAIYFIKVKYHDKNIKEILTIILGKKLAKGFAFFLIVYFLFISVVTLSSFIDFVYILFLSETPPLALIIWFVIFFLYGAYKGIKRIALTAGILVFFNILVGFVITTLDSTLKEWGQLRPILEFGWNPVLLGTLIIISIWVELIFLLCLPLKNPKEKGTALLWGLGILLNGTMMLSTTTGVMTIFGLGQAENMLYPAQEIVRILNLGFLDRFDIYGLVLNAFGTYIRCCLYFRLAYELSITEKSSTLYRRSIFTFLILVLTALTIYIDVDHFRVEYAISSYVYMFVLYPVPFILLLVSRWRRAAVN